MDVEALDVFMLRSGCVASDYVPEVKEIGVVPLCSLESLRGCSVKVVDIPQRETEVLVRMKDGIVSCFQNRCPHLGLSLDGFSDPWCANTEQIMCCAHRALFDPSTGACTSGPPNTLGKALTQIPFAVQNGNIVVKTPTVSDFLARLCRAA